MWYIQPTKFLRDVKKITCLIIFSIFYTAASYAQCTMSCIDQIQISLNQDCEAEVTYRMILRDPDNPYVCNPNGPSAYKVVVMDEEGTPIPNSPVITCEYIGRTLLVKAKHWFSGNSCWSKVLVEDKIAPSLQCEPVTLWCNQNGAPTSEGGQAAMPISYEACEESCQTSTLTYLDSDSIIYSCTDPEFVEGIAARINRTWTTCDDLGNCRSCVQVITFRIPNISEIDFPPSLTGADALTCGVCEPTNLDCTGKPTLHHTSTENALCNTTFTFEDDIINTGCEGSYTIERSWTYQNSCTEETQHYTQLIEIVDRIAPVITCVNGNPAVVASNESACRSIVTIPAASIMDDCASVENIYVTTKVYKIEEDATKNMVVRKEGLNGGFTADLEYGNYEVYYQAVDPCDNVSNNLGSACLFEVRDDIAPTPVCHESTMLTLDSEGKGLIYAQSFNKESTDNCCIDRFEVRKANDPTGVFGEFVEFTCADHQSEVVLKVIDCAGNEAICNIEIVIDDGVMPIILSCGADFSVNCSDGFTIDKIIDSLLTPPTVQEDCIGGSRSEVLLKHDFRNNCGEGAVIFEWQVFDIGGNGPVVCEQLVSFEDHTDVVLNFPPDFNIGSCTENLDLSPENTGSPMLEGNDCESFEVLHSDSPMIGNSGCMSFTRTWRVTNLCADTTLEHTQNINIADVEAPVLDCDGEFFDICLDEGSCTTSFIVAGVTVTDCNDSIAVRADWTFTPADSCGGAVLTGSVDIAKYGFATQELGPGQLWVNFYATDGCGNESICNRDYTIKDCQAPEILCIPGLSLNLDATGNVEVWANDFTQEIIDNCEPCQEEDYTFSFSRDSIEDVRFYDCEDLGLKTAQIWVLDKNGNQGFCPVTFIIKGAEECSALGFDTVGLTPDPLEEMAGITGRVFMEDGNAVEAVAITAENHLSELMDESITDGNGAYNFTFQSSANVLINPTKIDDILNGVTTYDIIQLRRHILGFSELDSPYKIVAADVNHTNTVTTADIVDLRKAILGVDETFRNNTSWRFIKADHQFSDPTNPFLDAMPENADIPELMGDMQIDFVAIKVGDLSGNATGSAFGSSTANSRNKATINFKIVEKELAKNDETIITFALEDATISGIQFTLNFDPRLVEITEIMTTHQVTESNFGTRYLQNGALTMSWDAPINTIEPLRFKLRVKANSNTAVSELFTINSQITSAEAYDQVGNVFPLGLEFLENKYDYQLYQNQPNPFQQKTLIRFVLPAKCQGKLMILDITGRTLKTIRGNFVKGFNELKINDLQQKGLLYYQLETDFGVLTQKMIQVE